MLVGIPETCRSVELGTAHLRTGKGGIVGIAELGFRAVYFFVEHVGLYAHSELSAEEFEAIGILHREALMGEKSEFVVLKDSTDAVQRVSQAEGHVGTGVHGASSIFKTRSMGLIGAVDTQLRVAPNGGGVVLRCKRPIMQKSWVLLGAELLR